MTAHKIKLFENISKDIAKMMNENGFKGKGEESFWGYLAVRGLEDIQRNYSNEQAIIGQELYDIFETVVDVLDWSNSDNRDIPELTSTQFNEEVTSSSISQLIKAIEEETNAHYYTEHFGVRGFYMSENREEVLGEITPQRRTEDQFIAVWRWKAEDLCKASLAVIPLGTFVTHALSGKIDYQTYLVVDDGIWLGLIE